MKKSLIFFYRNASVLQADDRNSSLLSIGFKESRNESTPRESPPRVEKTQSRESPPQLAFMTEVIEEPTKEEITKKSLDLSSPAKEYIEISSPVKKREPSPVPIKEPERTADDLLDEMLGLTSNAKFSKATDSKKCRLKGFLGF